jgi:signal transduction histidine kinase
LDWGVEVHRDVLGEGRLVLSDAPVASPEVRRTLRHDVRTPLAVILGQADLLELEALTPRQQRCVDVLRNHCERLEALLSDLAQQVAP